MKNYNELVEDITMEQLSTHYNASNQLEVLDFHIKYLRQDSEILKQYQSYTENDYNQNAIAFEVIKEIKERLGFAKYCTYCYSQNYEILEVNEESESAIVSCQCHDCGQKFDY